MKHISLDGSSLTLADAEAIARGAKLHINTVIRPRIHASEKLVANAAKSSKPIYGINTGFGYFANRKISQSDLNKLQTNIVKSHAAGFGEPLTISETRLAMALRLNVFVKGYTGVRYKLCQSLLDLINAEIYPLIPEYGSVGASGDLAPLAHLALPIIGEGKVMYKGNVMTASKALKSAGLTPLKLAPKEGLGLINGTQIMLSVGGLALASALRLINIAQRITGLTYEGLSAHPEPLNALIHEIRGQPGQIIIAKNISEHLSGSYIYSLKTLHKLVQDPYSVRCAPQILGPSLDALRYTLSVVETELNAATDNPLVFVEQNKILSGGNFHGQSLALAFDIASMAVSEIGNVSDRRIEVLLNPHLSGLNAFLTPYPGTHSGYMAAQYLSSSIVNENKLLANPACTDSIPGNVGIEDHVSMGMTSARKFKKIVQNTYVILAVEALVAAQAIDLRGVTKLGKGTKLLYKALRSEIPTLYDDRIIAENINKAVEIITYDRRLY